MPQPGYTKWAYSGNVAKYLSKIFAILAQHKDEIDMEIVREHYGMACIMMRAFEKAYPNNALVKQYQSVIDTVGSLIN